APGSKQWYRGVMTIMSPLAQSARDVECLEYVEELRRLEPAFETAALHARALVTSAIELVHVGRTDISHDLMGRLEGLASVLGHPLLFAWTRSLRGWIASFRGAPAIGLRETAAAAEGFMELEDRRSAEWARCVETMCAVQLGMWPRVFAAIERRAQIF